MFRRFTGLVDGDGIAAVRAALHAGLVPVLHGDVVLDSVQGASILSGDTILERLAFHFRPPRAVFLTNVMGVFDRPPEQEGAVMLREIVTEEGGDWRVLRCGDSNGGEASHDCVGMSSRDVALTTAAHDITGGIATKVREASDITLHGIDVYITQGGTSHAHDACVGAVGPGWLGTHLHDKR